MILPLLADEIADTYPEVSFLQAPVLVLAIVGVGTVQAAIVCVWRLATMAAAGSVFTRGAFRYVDAIIVCALLATALAVAAFALLAASAALQPGVVLAVVAAGVTGVGVALLVVVLRALLARAMALDAETVALHAALDEVI